MSEFLKGKFLVYGGDVSKVVDVVHAHDVDGSEVTHIISRAESGEVFAFAFEDLRHGYMQVFDTPEKAEAVAKEAGGEGDENEDEQAAA